MPHELLFESIAKVVTISDADKDAIASKFVSKKIRKGHFLVHRGSIERAQIFIVSGSAITYFLDLEGDEHVIQFGVEGWWVSDLQSYLYNKPASFNVEALEDCSVLQASFQSIQELYERVPAFERYHRIITQQGYAAFQQRMMENLSMSAEDRYRAFVERYGALELRFPQKVIASYLGMSPEFFSKLKKRSR